MDDRHNHKEQKRLKILGDDEIESIYGIPYLTQEDRTNYFSLSQTEKYIFKTLRSIKSKAYFVLQLGYFKVKHLFFSLDIARIEEDIRYVMKYYFESDEIIDINSIDKFTKFSQQRLILQLYNYRNCDAEIRQQLEKKAFLSATVCGKPIFIFRELMNYLSEQKIIIPTYSFFQDTVGSAIVNEQNRLISILKNHLSESDIEDLKSLLEDSSGLHEITQLKREPKDFSVGEIKNEINRGKQIEYLYFVSHKLLPELNISNESIKYYASLIGYYSVYKLKRLGEWIVYIYLLCFVYYRYQRMHDNLIDTLIFNVRRYIDESKSVAKEKVYVSYTEGTQNMKKAGQVLQIFTDSNIAPNTHFEQVQARAFTILERQKIKDISEQIATNGKFDENLFQWEHIDNLSRQIKRHFRPIFSIVHFASPLIDDSLIEVIDFMKTAFKKNKSLGQFKSEDLPNAFIPENMKRYIYQENIEGQKVILVDRYEFLVYRILRNGLV